MIENSGIRLLFMHISLEQMRSLLSVFASLLLLYDKGLITFLYYSIEIYDGRLLPGWNLKVKISFCGGANYIF